MLAAFDDGRKIGQIALIGQNVCIAGEIHPAVQLVDLFILQAYRSAQVVRKLYKEVEKFCAARNIRYILALPNEKSAPLNARFLKLRPVLWMPIRAGVSLRRPTPGTITHSGLLRSMTREQAIELFSPFICPANGNGSHWDAKTLFDRLDDPTCDYAVHATTNLLLASSRRKTKGVSYTTLCAFFARPSTKPGEQEVDELIRAACRHWKHAPRLRLTVRRARPASRTSLLATTGTASAHAESSTRTTSQCSTRYRPAVLRAKWTADAPDQPFSTSLNASRAFRKASIPEGTPQ